MSKVQKANPGRRSVTPKTPEQEIARLKKANKELKAEVRANSDTGLKYLDLFMEASAELDQLKKDRDEATARDPLQEPIFECVFGQMSIAGLYWEVQQLCESVRGCQGLIDDYLLAPIPWKDKDRIKEADVTKIISRTLRESWLKINNLIPRTLPDGRYLQEDPPQRDERGRFHIGLKEDKVKTAGSEADGPLSLEASLPDVATAHTGADEGRTPSNPQGKDRGRS